MKKINLTFPELSLSAQSWETAPRQYLTPKIYFTWLQYTQKYHMTRNSIPNNICAHDQLDELNLFCRGIIRCEFGLILFPGPLFPQLAQAKAHQCALMLYLRHHDLTNEAGPAKMEVFSC